MRLRKNKKRVLSFSFSTFFCCDFGEEERECAEERVCKAKTKAQHFEKVRPSPPPTIPPHRRHQKRHLFYPAHSCAARHSPLLLHSVRASHERHERVPRGLCFSRGDARGEKEEHKKTAIIIVLSFFFFDLDPLLSIVFLSLSLLPPPLLLNSTTSPPRPSPKPGASSSVSTAEPPSRPCPCQRRRPLRPPPRASGSAATASAPSPSSCARRGW